MSPITQSELFHRLYYIYYRALNEDLELESFIEEHFDKSEKKNEILVAEFMKQHGH